MKRVLIVGCGDVAQRALPWLTRHCRVYALVRRPERAEALRALGVTPIPGDLDSPRSLSRIAGLADTVLYSAPPAEGRGDARSRRLLAALVARGSLPRSLVYISTSGVYGDCRGEHIDETRPCRPATARAQRRVAAEAQLRAFARRQAGAAPRRARPVCTLSILRAPGIYAADRLSLERLRRADPVLRPEDDVYTNHIHADDLAHACVLAMFRAANGRCYNICDDAELRMGDYYDAMADAFGLPRPPRASREECAARLGPVTLSFMSESRRLSNRRARRELRWQPRWPDVVEALRAFGGMAPSSKEIA